MRQQRQTMRLLDSQNQALGQRNDQYKRERDNLQIENRNLEGTICNIQHQKEDLQLKFNSLERKHDQHLAELEDERTDKQQLQADKYALQDTINSQTQFSETVARLESKTEEQFVTISDLESKNCDLESVIEQQSVTISDLERKNSVLESETEQQSTTITAIQQQIQKQQYAILFLAALIFAMLCFHCFS